MIRDALGQLKRTGRVHSGQLRRVAEQLEVKGGILCFHNRVVVPKKARGEVLKKVHAAGHFGQKRTLGNLKRSYFWLGMTQEVRFFCQRAKPSNQPRVPLQEFSTEGIGPGDLVAMDVATLPWADEQFRHFLCIVDVFTRYIELTPLRDQKAASLVHEFERGWVFRGHGVPKGLLTDQAHNIDGVEVRNLCKRLGIEKRHSSPYHPQADGLVERCIGLVKQVARCLTLDCRLPKESWPDILPEVAFYCNNAQNASTKFSAQLLMTGRQPTSPIDASMGTRQWSELPSQDQHVERLREIKVELEALARENDGQCKAKRDEIRNEGTRLPAIKKGKWVMERNEFRKDSLDPKFEGPYLVLDFRNASIKIQRKNKGIWVHASRCKKYDASGGVVVTTAPIQGETDEMEYSEGEEHGAEIVGLEAPDDELIPSQTETDKRTRGGPGERKKISIAHSEGQKLR